MDGEPDRPTRVCQAAMHGLTNPPGCIGGESGPVAPVILAGGMVETKITVLDEILQVNTPTSVSPRYGHDQPQIRFDQLAQGGIAGVNSRRERLPSGGVVGCEQRSLRR